jgi:hypothetical protein
MGSISEGKMARRRTLEREARYPPESQRLAADKKTRKLLQFPSRSIVY